MLCIHLSTPLIFWYRKVEFLSKHVFSSSVDRSDIGWWPYLFQERMESTPRVMDDIPEEERGAIGLEMQKDETWEDITEIAAPQQDPVKQEENDDCEDDMDDETLDAYFEAEESLNESQVGHWSGERGEERDGGGDR